MDEFPTSEDEFDLMYGDDLDVLREQDDPQRTPKKSRKSLNFTRNNDPPAGTSQDLFEDDFTLLENSQTAVVEIPSSSNKRSIEELFGDIDDILNEKPQPKRHKSDKSYGRSDEYALIEHILELRRLAKERDAPEGVRRDYTSVGDRDRNNLSYNVPTYPFIGVKRYDKEKVYVRFHSEQYEKEDRDRIIQEINVMGNLASDELWSQAQDLILKQTENDIEISVDANSSDTDLWVDLYKPRKYFELLSDESTNRIILKWIKLWDKVVFKRRPKLKPKDVKKDFKTYKIDLCTDLDEHGRPHHKVALLCGPPGLGKTTLAHMVARHAGYNVVEINASDDRSLEFFKTSLENATQMRSVLDAEKRPNCLVFDEIDGAPAASIDYLVKFISGAAVNKNKKKNQKEKNILKRPIICICNDVYVPALRPLRQIAFVVNFPPTSNTRLTERLMEIAKWQKVKTDTGAMLALAEKSQNDIRSCLSILHLFKTQSKPVTLSDVHKTSIGEKDTHKGIFSVWQDIFQIEGRKSLDKKYDSLKDRMSKILNVVHSFGDYEKVAQGVFENFPNLNFKSSNMAETCWALEWFSYSDILNKEIYSTQEYSLSGYLPYAFVVWHFAFGNRTWQKLQYPSAGYEARMKQNRQTAIIGEMLRGMQPTIKSYVQPKCLTLDIIPMLSLIISPTFRPISLHLYTDDEKKILDHVVNVMADYNLNYVQERTSDGTYVYKLDPNIDDVVSFISMKCLSYSNKQLIAQEIETVKMRRFETSQQSNKPKTQPVRSTNTANAAIAALHPALMPNHLQTLKARSFNTAEIPAVVKDFFGRTVSKKSSSSGKTPQNSKNDIWYQYKEGYSNAVRKKIKIASLK